MRMMGAESVEYHRATVLGRGDDHPGMALEYYASRGETPLVWGGSGTAGLGLEGAVSPESLRGHLRPRRCPRPEDGRAAGADPSARHGGRDLGPQERGGARGDRPGRRHAPDHGRRARRHAWVLGQGDPPDGREARGSGQSIGDGRAHLCPHPPRHFEGRRPLPSRPCPAGQPVEMKDEKGGWKAADTAAVAGAPARRHHGRPGGGSPGGGRTGLRHRGRPRPLGSARALEDRRRPRRSYGAPLQAGGRDRGRVPAPRRGAPTVPAAWPPGPPARPNATSR